MIKQYTSFLNPGLNSDAIAFRHIGLNGLAFYNEEQSVISLFLSVRTGRDYEPTTMMLKRVVEQGIKKSEGLGPSQKIFNIK